MLPPGLGPDQSRVCQFVGTQTAQNRESWQRDTGTEREKGGLGRAAEIREHRSVFNQGYVQVRERQRALLLAHLSLEEHVKGKVDGG